MRRYTGIDRQDAGSSTDYNPEMPTWNHEFAPAMNDYVRRTLGYKTDLQYNLFGPVHPWDKVGDTYREDEGGEKLRTAMAMKIAATPPAKGQRILRVVRLPVKRS